jgi:Tol biopolymer transport system component
MGQADVFLWDRTTGTTVLVSHAAAGATTAGNGGAVRNLGIAADGSAVAFLSGATDLIAGGTDSNGAADAYVWDRATGIVTLASHAAGAATQAGNGESIEVALSGDGAFVAFTSRGTNHVAGQVDPDPTSPDVFVFSRASGTIVLASRKASSATNASIGADRPAISADGRYVGFASPDTGLVGGQVDGGLGEDVFLYDRIADTTALVSHAAGASNRAGQPEFGERALAISDDGGAVVHASPAVDLVTGLADTNAATDLFRWAQTGTNELITRRAANRPSATGGGASYVLGRPISAPDAAGRYVAFTSNAIGLVPGQVSMTATNQVYARDRNPAAPATSIVSHASASPLVGGNADSDAGVASADGRWFAFWSASVDLGPGFPPPGNVGLYLEDRLTGSLLRVATSPAGKTLFDDPSPHAISADGRFLAFVSGATNLVPGQIDTNNGPDVFLFDRVAGTTVLASHSNSSNVTAADGPSGHVSLDASGRYLAFESLGSNVSPGQFDNQGFLDVFVFDAQTGVADLVSRSFDTPNGPVVGTSHAPEISADGRWVAFRSDAFDVVSSQVEGNSGDDVFLYDRTLNFNVLVSRQAGTAATTGNAPCDEAKPSGDGRYVAFSCRATDLVTGQSDGNGISDLFLFDRLSGTSTLVSHAVGSPLLAQGIDAASPPSISRDGRFVAYASGAALAAGSPPRTNVFLFDRLHATNALASRPAGAPTPGPSGTCINPQISADGSVVAFASTASDLVADDRNRASDVFAAKNASLGQYFTVTPCRLYDSRADGAGPLASGVPRIRAAHGLCGVPTTATAIAANVTVTAPTALGFLTLYPGDSPAPGVATLNFSAGQTRTNNAMVQLATDGTGSYAASAFVQGSGTVQVIVDVAGYFE